MAQHKTRSVSPAGKRFYAVLAVLAVIIGGYWAYTALFSGPPASYAATVTGHTIVDPATLSVAIRVTNTGKGTGTPSCQINASDPSGSHTGADLVTLQNALGPGQSTNFADPHITITGQGAASVTQVSVKCS